MSEYLPVRQNISIIREMEKSERWKDVIKQDLSIG